MNQGSLRPGATEFAQQRPLMLTYQYDTSPLFSPKKTSGEISSQSFAEVTVQGFVVGQEQLAGNHTTLQEVSGRAKK